jgi:hypothetical protein
MGKKGDVVKATASASESARGTWIHVSVLVPPVLKDIIRSQVVLDRGPLTKEVEVLHICRLAEQLWKVPDEPRLAVLKPDETKHACSTHN